MTDRYRWPDDILPPFPLNESYKVNLPDLLSRTDFEQGVPRQRNVFSSGATGYEITLPFNPTQFAIFQGIFRHQLANGAKWFDAPVFDGVDYTVRCVRFVKGSIKTARSGGEWLVSFVLETMDEVAPDDALTAYLMISYGNKKTPAELAALLHGIVHVDLPAAVTP